MTYEEAWERLVGSRTPAEVVVDFKLKPDRPTLAKWLTEEEEAAGVVFKYGSFESAARAEEAARRAFREAVAPHRERMLDELARAAETVDISKRAAQRRASE